MAFRVVIGGGGVAALEALLALHDLAEDRVDLTLISPQMELRYRPASVGVPFGRSEVYRFPLDDIVRSVGAKFVHSALRGVNPVENRATTEAGDEVGYDALLIAIGASRRPVLAGALPFRGEEDTAAMQSLLEDIRRGTAKHLVFALPRGASWALPLYELALLTGSYVAEHRIHGVSIDLVTPEQRPLAQFGGAVSDAVEQLLREHRITLHTGKYPASISEGRLMLVPAAVLPADRVICIAAAVGVRLPGVPSTPDGFLAVDEVGRVRGLDDVYAAGDITAYPIKQGGIAAQQADIAAHAIANRAGADLGDPPALLPVLRGLLITGGQPRYLLTELGGGRGETAVSSTEPLWWPASKIAAKYLGPYLAQASQTTTRNTAR